MDHVKENYFLLNYSDKMENIMKNLNEINITKDEKNLIFTNCPSITAANNLMNNSDLILTIIVKFPAITAIKIEINEEFYPKDVLKPKNNFLSDDAVFLMCFESTINNNIVIHWKNKNFQHFITLELFQIEISSDLKTFILNYFIESLIEGGKITATCEEINLTTIINNNDINLLTAAVEKRNLNILKELMKFPFDVNDEIRADENDKEYKLKAIDIAWKNNDQRIVIELLKGNSIYPKKFDKSIASAEIIDFLKISENLHEKIKLRDLNAMNDILEKYKNHFFYFNSENVSALKQAFQIRNVELYKLLYEHNLSFGPNEDLNNKFIFKIYKDLSEINSEMAWLMPEYHIMILLSKTVISRNDRNYIQNFQKIKKSFEMINQIEEINLTLRIIATSYKTKLHFDFTQDSVMYMDPSKKTTTRGVFIASSHHMYIAAKGLLKSATKNNCLGTMAHEACHSCMNLVFMNVRQPFAIDDIENERRFKAIVTECDKILYKMHEKNEKLESIVDAVYYYDESAHMRELIVRVPHMLAFYHDNQPTLNKLKETFKNLFDYYEEIVMPEMKKALPVLEKLSNNFVEIKFDELTEPLKAAIKHSVVNFQGHNVKLKKITDENVLKTLSSKQIRKILNMQLEFKIKTNFVIVKDFYKERKFIHTKFDKEIWKFNMETNDYELNDQAQTAVLDFDAIYSKMIDSKSFILSDHAGAGKSMTMKYFATKIKVKNSNSWINYIDLKHHLKTYEKYKNELSTVTQNTTEEEKIEMKEKILEIIIEVLSITKNLDLQVFKYLFRENRVILFYDGFDEIAPKYEEFFLNLFGNITVLTNNQLWIATRPQHENELVKRIKCKMVYKMLPLTKSEVLELVEKYAKYNNLNYDKNEILEIIKKLKVRENPLMLTMITELLHVNKISLKNLNNFSLYEAMIEMKKDVLAQKGEIANQKRDIDSKINLWEVHQIYALKTIFHNHNFEDFCNQEFLNCNSKNYNKEFIDFNQFQLLKKWKREKSKWSADAISRSGLLTIFDWDTDSEYSEFNHQTYAEYFVAKFVIENVTEAIEEGDELSDAEFKVRMKFAIFMLKNYCVTSSYDVICNFIIDYLSNQKEKIFVSEKFDAFLEEENTKIFIETLFNMLSFRTGYDYRFSTFLSNAIEFFSPNEKLINLLILLNDDRSKLFEISLNRGFLLSTINIFEVLKNTKRKNWHYLTGFGLNLTTNKLNLPTDFELENNDFITRKDFVHSLELKKFQLNEWNEQQELKFFRQFYQFFCFIQKIDFKNEIMEKIFQNFRFNLSLFIFRSKSLIEIFFDIFEKYFKTNRRLLDILKPFGTQTALILQENKFCKISSKFIDNFEYFYLKAEIFLASNRFSMQILLKNYKILQFTILNNIHLLKQMYIKQFEKKKLFSLFIDAFEWHEFEIDIVSSVQAFDNFCKEISEFTTAFQLFFNKSCDYELLPKLINAYKKFFNDEWHKYTGYELKQLKEIIILSDDELQKLAEEKFLKIDLTDKCITYNGICNEFIDIFNILYFIDSFEIPENLIKKIFNSFSERLPYKYFGEILLDNVIETLNEFKMQNLSNICEYIIFFNLSLN